MNKGHWRSCRPTANTKIEADESDYVANEGRVRNRSRIHLDQDPPPDLVIDVDFTHSSIDKLALFAALGIPEGWRYADGRLSVYRLSADGTYEAARHSLAFPPRPLDEVKIVVADYLAGASETRLLRGFRDRVLSMG